MKLKVGEIVTLKHYSGKKINKGLISDVESNNVVVRPEKDFLIYSYFIDDPLVLGYENENIVSICEAVVTDIDYNKNTISVNIKNIQTLTNKRITQRFPVSLSAYITNHNEKLFAYIRNISLDGLSICSKLEKNKGDIINVQTIIENKELIFDAKIMWKKPGKLGFEYGLVFESVGEEFVENLESCLLYLKMDQESALDRLKYDFNVHKKRLMTKSIMN
ncbi:PilZ domain-containing protein [Acetivibrio saccincola]|uniref:PilZ domain-containing protein n=1 Tax=Acetivibrio saccincola TaxID=1677857 RepID=UPI00169B9ACA|nr:PilZ domain-containing protein [Acetivibrio saccincola]NLW26034.1 PilZ domain-containing protein [Acetivibrio saccincola]HOA97923.1 PilZ domain-containing protein [Acetivibrio saccincola]HQD29536.1 PilZ domain-containing protein [Acetivibrio saccincola]